jgi:hypothetical protein
LQELKEEPLVNFSAVELDIIGDMLAEHAAKMARNRMLVNDDWRECPGLVIINRDLDELPTMIPKWSALVSWLTPESALGSAPDLVERIAKLTLSRQLHLQKKRR